MINNNVGEPVYQQIIMQLRQGIFLGEYNPGDILPSESSLAAKFGTSRVTVRKGLKELEHEGLLYSRPGKGYFVAQPKHDQFVFDFSNEDAGFEARYNQINIIEPNEEICACLKLVASQSVIELSKVIFSHEQPVGYDIKYLPYDKGTPLIEAEINFAVFPEIAAQKATPYAFYTNMEVGVEHCNATIQKALRCKKNAPLLVIYRTLIGQDEVPVGYGKKYLTEGYGRICGVAGHPARE